MTKVASQDTSRTVDLRKRVEVRRVKDGSIRNVGVLVAEAGLKSGIYTPADEPVKKKAKE